jgi:clan AA aspartic protease
VISGAVPTGREAVVPVTIHDALGGRHEVLAVVDTGFTSTLTLPATLITSLGLVRRGSEEAILGDGSVVALDYFDAVVEWDGVVRPIIVHATDGEILIGMTLLAGYELTIQVVPGGTVKIVALP